MNGILTGTSTEVLSGKSLVFTDLHIGISNDRQSRQKIASDFIDEIIGRIEVDGIKQVFFLGDLFHHRTAIEVTSLNVANDLIRKLSACCKVFLLQGNHDLYEKYNSVITSLNIFDLDNVTVVSVPTEVRLNGAKVLLVPWLCGTSLHEFISSAGISSTYDIMMGHFDIGYSGEIQNKGSKYANAYSVGTENCSEVEVGNIINEILHHTSNFSTIFMGHIHDHETVSFANRTWNIVGSPQYQVHDMKRLPDSKKMHGYYTLDESNGHEFHESRSVPRFVTVYASDLVNGTIDESRLRGSVVRRCYDVVLSDEQKQRLDGMIGAAGVYEEDPSVFVLGLNGSQDGTDYQADSTEMGIIVDKFDYISSQIGKISHPAIDNARLADIMRMYYERATST